MEIIPVILSGGYGTRLWPLSRKQYPKQYLPLTSDNTMLQETILRISTLITSRIQLFYVMLIIVSLLQNSVNKSILKIQQFCLSQLVETLHLQ